MSYYIDFQSFKDTIKNSKSFALTVIPKQGNAVISSFIPIEVLDEVMVDVDLVRNESNGISIWIHSGGARLVTFAPGTIDRIDVIFY